MQDPRIAKCLTAKRESRSVEFKESFIPTDPRQSLEVLKDIVAIANSGGGTLAVGINNTGEASGADVIPVLDHDHAKYCDLVRKYTLQNYADFELIEAEKDGHQVAIFLINAPDYPLIFEKVGTCPIENSKFQHTAFAQGTVFFRHGAKTETATTDDLRKFMQSRIREMQEQLVKGLRKVSEAPRGAILDVVPTVAQKGVFDSAGMGGIPIKISDDVDAQIGIPVDRHDICPYRQKEVMAKLKVLLPEGPLPTTHDIQTIVKTYDIGSKPQFAWKPEFSSRQYSEAFIGWLVDNLQTDPNFLFNVRQKFYEMTHPNLLPLI
jgi:hypothetical protein